MKQLSFSTAAKQITEKATKLIQRRVSRSQDQTILIPCDQCIVITIMSGENGVYPVCLARIDDCGFYGVDEGEEYNLSDIADDLYDGFVCCGMGYEEIEPRDLCLIADYLSKRSKYAERYGHIVSKAQKVLSMIPARMTVHLSDVETNYLNSEYNFQWGRFCNAIRGYAITADGHKIPWENFTTDDLLVMADGVLEALMGERWTME